MNSFKNHTHLKLLVRFLAKYDESGDDGGEVDEETMSFSLKGDEETGP